MFKILADGQILGMDDEAQNGINLVDFCLGAMIRGKKILAVADNHVLARESLREFIQEIPEKLDPLLCESGSYIVVHEGRMYFSHETSLYRFAGHIFDHVFHFQKTERAH